MDLISSSENSLSNLNKIIDLVKWERERERSDDMIKLMVAFDPYFSNKLVCWWNLKHTIENNPMLDRND